MRRETREEAVERTAAQIRIDLAAAGHPVFPGGQITEGAAALVLGIKRGSLRNARARLAGPPWIAGNGQRVLYDVRELARYMRRQRP